MSPFQRNFELPGRSAAMGRRGMAATSHPAATLTAINVLQAGGNALDAAIAACAVQCVVDPGSTGIGGDCFALLGFGSGSEIVSYNGAGRAPSAASAERYRNSGMIEIPRQSPHAVTIPGAVDAWARLNADYGRKSLGELLTPAIELAQEGYVVAPRVALDWSRQEDVLRNDANASRMLLVDGRAPAAGTVHRQPELAASLRSIGNYGPAAFYEGDLAADMIEYLGSLGGLHTGEDFRSARGAYETPVKTSFRGYDVYECAPSGQGIIALLILNILKGFNPDDDPLSPNRIHREIEAARLAYSVRDAVLGDPRQAQIPIEWLLSDQFAYTLRERIDLSCRIEQLPTFAPPAHHDTVYISVVDKDRMAVSFINSIFMPFGSGLMSPRAGILFHNRGQSFVLEPGHPNEIAPAKIPLHTIIPGFLAREGRIQMPFGVMGGHYQALGHAHLISKIIDYGIDVQTAIDMPRFFPRPGFEEVDAEETLPDQARRELERRGFKFTRPAAPLGGAQAIWIDWENGVLIGGSDHRKDGCALGW